MGQPTGRELELLAALMGMVEQYCSGRERVKCPDGIERSTIEYHGFTCNEISIGALAEAGLVSTHRIPMAFPPLAWRTVDVLNYDVLERYQKKAKR